MSWVKEVIDASRDLASDTIALRKIKRSLLTQCQLNGKLLSEFYRSRNGMTTLRKEQIAGRLDVNELEAVLNCGVPFALISRKTVTKKKLEQHRIRAKSIEGNNLEVLLEKVYLMAAYLRKDHDNPTINLNSRLINLYKYNRMLIDLLK